MGEPTKRKLQQDNTDVKRSSESNETHESKRMKPTLLTPSLSTAFLPVKIMHVPIAKKQDINWLVRRKLLNISCYSINTHYSGFMYATVDLLQALQQHMVTFVHVDDTNATPEQQVQNKVQKSCQEMIIWCSICVHKIIGAYNPLLLTLIHGLDAGPTGFQRELSSLKDRLLKLLEIFSQRISIIKTIESVAQLHPDFLPFCYVCLFAFREWINIVGLNKKV